MVAKTNKAVKPVNPVIETITKRLDKLVADLAAELKVVAPLDGYATGVGNAARCIARLFKPAMKAQSAKAKLEAKIAELTKQLESLS